VFGVAATLLTAVLTVLPPERASAAGADRPAAVSPKTPRIHTSQAAAGTASERRARTPPVPAPPEFTFAPPPLGQVGIAYSTPLTVSGGTSPFTWSIVAGSLPPGITLEAGTGLLSGTPTAADHYTFTVRLVDALEQTISRTVALDVTAAPVFTFPAPPAGQEGLLYGASLTVSGGTAPFTWSASAGSPPPGLGLDPQTGRLSGTPSAAGSYPFTVTVTDDAGLTDTRPVSLVISAGPLIVLHTADVSTVPVGGIVHLTTRVTNTSAVPFTSVTVRDTLVDLLDDATYNGDASATTGTVAYVSQTLTWTGDLPAGAVVTISYSVTVASPPGET